MSDAIDLKCLKNLEGEMKNNNGCDEKEILAEAPKKIKTVNITQNLVKKDNEKVDENSLEEHEKVLETEKIDDNEATTSEGDKYSKTNISKDLGSSCGDGELNLEDPKVSSNFEETINDLEKQTRDVSKDKANEKEPSEKLLENIEPEKGLESEEVVTKTFEDTNDKETNESKTLENAKEVQTEQEESKNDDGNSDFKIDKKMNYKDIEKNLLEDGLQKSAQTVVQLVTEEQKRESLKIERPLIKNKEDEKEIHKSSTSFQKATEKNSKTKEKEVSSAVVEKDDFSATESQDSEQLVIDEIAVVKSLDDITSTIEINDKTGGKDNQVKSVVDSIKTTQTENTNRKSIFEVIEIDDDEDEIAATKPDDSGEANQSQPPATKIVEEVEVSSTVNIVEGEKDPDVINIDKSNQCAKMHTMPMLFYNKECINFECLKDQKEFHRAPQFALNYFNVVKKKIKVQYICGECYDTALNFYQDLCGSLDSKQPILLRDIANKKQEFVEILDSSDEEGDSTINDTENKDKDNQFFSKSDLNLIENELENSIKNIFNRVEIQNQLTWTKTIFTERIKRLQSELEYIDTELGEQQKLADKMYNTLYETGKYNIITQKPLELDVEVDNIPPIGEVERLPIKISETYYAAKNKAIGCWLPCKVIEHSENVQVGLQKSIPSYRVKFLNTQYQTFKNLSAKLMAYFDPPSVRLSVGQRVIAYFDGTTLSRDKDKCVVQSAFYPGIIAEEMKQNNYFRYLIFYDDGYTQYVSHKDVRLVCNVARNVWEDVDPTSREFIQKYIMEYRVNRPMVQTHKGQKMATESNGRWVPARVIDIDCSLVRMQFEGPNKNHTEWIYRGSLRLNPVYMEYQKSKTSQVNRNTVSRLPRRTEPFIRYTEDEESIRGTLGTQQRQSSNRQEHIATNQAPKVRHLNANTIYLEDENKTKGKVIHYTAKRQLIPKLYQRHTCGAQCPFIVEHNLNGYSPLAKPLLSGWERAFVRQRMKKFVFYRAPCGKMLRNMKEVHKYLRLTRNPLNVENFDFYTETSCLAEFEPENVLLKKRDISNGQEKMPLPLVNYYDESLPECKYSSRVIPTEGVNINTDPNFLVCCDCEDDCVDKEKCACWQMTIEGVKTINPDIQTNDIGYQYKRLYNHLPTGIYECNSRCKCKSYCINRVVQHSLEMKLQVFKTTNRGWGLRCLNDVPRGAFVCIYAGNLLTEAKANEGGKDAGDEYFAELDYIETVEQLKEGYESDVETQEDDDDELPDDNDDDDFRPSRSFLTRSRRSQRDNSGDGERQAINFNPNVTIDEDSNKKRLSVRQLFGRDEAVYVMDAKVTGNLGRYFNHSCSPNLFVQNVFVDTHDVRFPWVAFFALTHIRAGTELTWNYNYEVGVVPGKVLYCQCGAPNCRQRLL